MQIRNGVQGGAGAATGLGVWLWVALEFWSILSAFWPRLSAFCSHLVVEFSVFL
jgi:hypothetical protein